MAVAAVTVWASVVATADDPSTPMPSAPSPAKTHTPSSTTAPATPSHTQIRLPPLGRATGGWSPVAGESTSSVEEAVCTAPPAAAAVGAGAGPGRVEIWE